MSKRYSESVRAERTAKVEQMNIRWKPSFGVALFYVIPQSPKRQKSKESTKRSKTFWKTREIVEMQQEQEELEKQTEAHKNERS